MSTAARLRRLARKPPRYLVWRAAQEARRRRVAVAVARTARGRGRAGTLPGDVADVLRRTEEAVAGLVAGPPPGGDAAVRARRGDVLARRLELFGEAPVDVGIPPRWLEDAHSGHGWPPGDAMRVDYVNRGRPSDVKVAWELSRLRHLVTLAQLVAQDGDAAAAAALEADLADWIAVNPMGWTVNWTVGMETALRAVNLICVDGLLVGRPRDREPLVRSLYQHGWHLSRHLEISDVNGNHYLANAVGLIWLGRYFAGTGEAARWLRTGLEMARAAAREQVHPDGTDHEGSLPYHVLVLEMFLVARHAAGAELAGIDPVLAGMAAALETLAGPNGAVPDIGDDDGGRVLAFSTTPSKDARRVLGLAAAVLGRPAADPPGVAAADAAWLCGPPATEARPPRRPARFADGGFAVLGRGGDHVVVPCGAVGFRGRGGHGHLDALAPVAWLGGRLVLRDSGTGSYTGDPELRNRLRDAPAHSGLVVADRPYARIGGPDRLWAVDGDAVPEVIRLEGDRAAHVLELRQRYEGVDWIRTLRWTPGRLEGTDRVAAPAGTGCALRLQLTPAADWSIDGPPGSRLEVTQEPASEHYLSVHTAPRATLRWTSDGEEATVTWRVR